ncbi:MAG: sugar phosphate isomerase/epimerase family protein [Capsulimonadales bacterium]|nr:sugar phosphate isomerase/epimerase family protein [Capsulimonadales bacterium]
MQNVRSGLTIALCVLGAMSAMSAMPSVARPETPVRRTQSAPDVRTGGFLLGCQAWCFHRYTVLEAIEKTAQAGGKTIEFFPGQAFSPERREVRLGPETPDDVLDAVKAHLTKYGIKPVAFGVTGLSKDEKQTRAVFEFAKKMGIGVINTECDADAMETVEKLVKEYDIKVGIHNHPRQQNNPGYRHWDPNFILSLVKNRDRRIGACADMGHFVRSGIKPLDALRILEGRIVASHLKDLNEFAPGAHDVPYGTGVSDIRAILTEFRRQKFEGPISVEYEHNWESSVPEIAQCIGFVRGFGK